MKWIDYREKLGIGFNDNDKYDKLKNRFKMFFKYSNMKFFDTDFVGYSLMVGELLESDTIGGIYRNMIAEHTMAGFISKCVALYNVYGEHGRYDAEGNPIDKEYKPIFLQFLEKSLSDLKITYQIEKDNDGIFIFPKGAKELDDALVSEPLEWLTAYQTSRKAWIKALKDYSDQTDESASDVADKFRKALEAFFQEFFGGTKTLENYKSTYGTYLKEAGVPSEISGNFESLLQSYTNYINNFAKHQDKTSKKVLEYIMYQTGNIIRLLISLKSQEDSTNAD